MHRRTIAYLFLLIFLSLPWGSVQSEEKHSWAVCIEESSFEGHEFGEAVKQALMSGGWKESHIKVVKENSSDAFFNALDWLKSKAGEDDTTLFYFSGHGYNGGVEMGGEKISYATVNETLDETNCNSIFIVLDACHSGSAIPSLEKEGRVIITSCHGDETSGYFSEPFINALSIAADCNGNLDESVSAEEIFSYIMSDWHIGSYTPQIKDDYEGTLSILSAHWEGKKAEVYQTHAQRSVDNFGGEKWLRQSFIPLSTPIVGVSLKMAKWKNATDAYVGIYDENFNAIGTILLPTHIAHDVDDISTWIFLDMHVDVTPGGKYFLVCKSNSTWWWWGSGQWYLDGKAYVSSDEGNSWHEHSKISDFSFIIYGEKDITPPEVSLFHPNGGEMISGATHISWTASDNNDENLNNDISLFYSYDNGKTWDTIATGIKNNGMYEWDTKQKEDGSEYLIKVTAVDSSGNEGKDISNGVFTVDNTPPETTCEAYGERGKNNWYVNKTTVILSAYDSTSDVFLYYKLADQWREYTKPLTLNKDGKHEFSYYGEDAAGNRDERKNVVIKVDCTPPNISFMIPEEEYLYFFGKKIFPLPKNTILIGKMMIKIYATDETSGISQVTFFRDEEHVLDDGDEPYEWEWESSFFEHEIKSIAYDNAGNQAQIKQTIFSLTF